MLAVTNLIAQNNSEVHYYYIAEESYDLLKPSTIITNADKTLNLTFTQNQLTSYFSNKIVYEYNRQFEWSKYIRFHKYYLLGMDSDNLTNELKSLDGVTYAQYAGTIEDIEGVPLETPNDYFDHAFIQNYWVYTGITNQGGYHISNLRAYEHLELINARRAWNITTGNPNIAIGIRDVYFNSFHEDVEDKIIAHYGNQTIGYHGLSVASVAAGDTNNNGTGLASIGYNTSLVTTTSQTGSGAGDVLFLAENHDEVKVVNISLSLGQNDVEAEMFEFIHDSIGVTVVAAAGNGWIHTSAGDPTIKLYPASYDHVISVSSVGSYEKYGHVYPNGHSAGWKDVHQWAVGQDSVTHQHNDKVDIVAPGYNVPAAYEDYYRISRGSSYASPIVAGVAALMYDVYPDITPFQVKKILKESAENIYHIPENQQYAQDSLLGSGRVNAYAAVLRAKCLGNFTPGLDLTLQNSVIDYGDEPDTVTDIIWESPDIWVRNQQDGYLFKESENLHYQNASSEAFIYVRITNDSCEDSTGNEMLNLYWAKGGLSQTWPTVWEGDANTPELDFGNNVGVQNIPILKPGESTILEFQWSPNNPEDYEDAGFENPWMFCFLARIVTENDEMSFPEGSSAATNARNNNNIAYKNETVINVGSRPNNGSIVIGNIGSDNSLVSNIEFFTNTTIDNNLWLEAEVRAVLNEELWDLWQDSGAQSTSVRVIDQTNREIILLDNSASLNNILFAAGEWGIASISVNFLIHEVDSQEEYTFHVQQCDVSNQETLGGFTFTFQRNNLRQSFNAGYNSVANTDHSVTIYAANINEDALYNWYDEDGILVYSGSDFTVSSIVAEKFKLEVIAEEDGHKDYTEIETEDKRGISFITPNPASITAQIGYLISNNDNGYFMITNTATGSSHNFVINNQVDTINIALQHLPTGAYVVNLVIDGAIIDAKHLLIN